MIADIRGLLDARPFQAFCVVTSSGDRYRVPSADHADLNPQGSRLIIWSEDETWVVISGMHISAIELGNPHAAA